MTKGWCSNDKLYKIFTVANLNLYINLVDKINSKVSYNTSTNAAPQFLQQLAPFNYLWYQCTTKKKIYLLFDHSWVGNVWTKTFTIQISLLIYIFLKICWNQNKNSNVVSYPVKVDKSYLTWDGGLSVHWRETG